jgi:hypothetical protein
MGMRERKKCMDTKFLLLENKCIEKSSFKIRITVHSSFFPFHLFFLMKDYDDQFIIEFSLARFTTPLENLTRDVQ